MPEIAQRKRPLQARAQATVEAILEATSQVLVKEGWDKLTTTRVAERAGVSVGTLYQYFPSRESLVAAIMDRYADAVASAIEEASTREGKTLAETVGIMIDALCTAKLSNPELSVAIRSQIPRVEGVEHVSKIINRCRKAIRPLLARHKREIPDDDLEARTFVTVHAVSGVMDAALEQSLKMLGRPAFQAQLVALALGYLTTPTPAVGVKA